MASEARPCTSRKLAMRRPLSRITGGPLPRPRPEPARGPKAASTSATLEAPKAAISTGSRVVSGTASPGTEFGPRWARTTISSADCSSCAAGGSTGWAVAGTELVLAGCRGAVWAKSGVDKAKGKSAAALLESARRRDIGETCFSYWLAISQPDEFWRSVYNVSIRLFRRRR